MRYVLLKPISRPQQRPPEKIRRFLFWGWQEISAAVIEAEQRIGEILLEIPKASGQYARSENRPMSKNTLVKDMGYTKDEAHDYQQMAKHPEVVQKVIDDAIANGLFDFWRKKAFLILRLFFSVSTADLGTTLTPGHTL